RPQENLQKCGEGFYPKCGSKFSAKCRTPRQGCMTIIRSEGNVNKCLVWLAAIRAIQERGKTRVDGVRKERVERVEICAAAVGVAARVVEAYSKAGLKSQLVQSKPGSTQCRKPRNRARLLLWRWHMSCSWTSCRIPRCTWTSNSSCSINSKRRFAIRRRLFALKPGTN